MPPEASAFPVRRGSGRGVPHPVWRKREAGQCQGTDGAAGDRRRAGGRREPGAHIVRLQREFRMKRLLPLLICSLALRGADEPGPKPELPPAVRQVVDLARSTAPEFFADTVVTL